MIKLRPNAHTTVAPVGRSKKYEAEIPTMLVSVPTNQPASSRLRIVFANRTPHTAGTMRKEKTTRTPAISTELVTTTPKVA